MSHNLIYSNLIYWAWSHEEIDLRETFFEIDTVLRELMWCHFRQCSHLKIFHKIVHLSWKLNLKPLLGWTHWSASLSLVVHNWVQHLTIFRGELPVLHSYIFTTETKWCVLMYNLDSLWTIDLDRVQTNPNPRTGGQNKIIDLHADQRRNIVTWYDTVRYLVRPTVDRSIINPVLKIKI